MATVQELLVKITGDASNFKKAIDETKNSATQIGSAFEGIGQKISSIGKSATAALTVPIAGAATASVKNFAEVDKTMTLTNATMQNTEQEAKLLEQAMMSAAQNSTFGMSDASTATLNFARAGLNAKQAASALAPAMNLAAGEGGNLDTVSQGLVATINGFGDSFTNTGKYADVFANACNNSALDVNGLSSAMATAAPIFSAAGYSVNDAALYMGVMADAGIPASEAANSLKTGMARLISPAKDGATWMKKLGIEVTNADGSMKDSVTVQKELHDAFAGLSESEQIAAASAIFGKNQMSKWLALINTAPEDVAELNGQIAQQGTTMEMANSMMSGFGGSLEKLKSSIDVASYSFGQALAPSVSKVADGIQKAVDWFNSLDKSQQQTIAKAALLVAGIGPVLLIFGKLTTGVGSVVTAFGKIGGALGKTTGLFGSVGGAASTMGGQMAGAGSAVGGAAASFGTFAGQALKLAAVAGVILAAAAAIKILVGAAIELYNAGPGAIATFAGLTAAAIAITGAIAAIGSACTATAPGLLALGGTVLMVSGGIALVTAAVALVIEAFSHLVDSITKLCDKLPLISQYGADAAKGLAQLSLGVAALGTACAAAAIPIGALDLALAAFDVTAGLATPIMLTLSGAIVTLSGSIVALSAAMKICETTVKSCFTTMRTIISTVVNDVVKFISGLVKKVINFFKKLKYELIGDPIVVDMVNGIVKWFKELVTKVVEFVSNLVQKVVEFFTNLKDKVIEKVNQLKEKVQEYFNNLKEKVIETVEKLKEKVKEHFDKLKEKVTETTDRLKEKVQETWTKLKEKVTELTTQLSDKIKEKFTQIKDNITEKVTQAKDKAREKFTELKEKVTDKMRETVDNVKQKLDDMVNKFKGIDLVDVGKNIISGFLKGLKDAWDDVKDWVSNACKNIKDKFESAMKIGSPSKVFFQYGKWIDQGLVNGLNQGMPNINSAIDRMNQTVATNFNATVEGGTGSNTNTTINLNGDYMFQDKASMDYFLNRMQLAIQRA